MEQNGIETIDLRNLAAALMTSGDDSQMNRLKHLIENGNCSDPEVRQIFQDELTVHDELRSAYQRCDPMGERREIRSELHRIRKIAIAVCNTCGVQKECYDFAVDAHQGMSVMGGKSSDKRSRANRIDARAASK